MRIFKPHTLGLGIELVATGAYLPPDIISNAELVKRGVPLTEEEIVKLSGILERRFGSAHQATSDLAFEACKTALAQGGVAPGAIDRLVLGTVSPDHPSPSTACALQKLLGLAQVPAFDLSAACSGFIFALDACARGIATGDGAALAVAADMRSRVVDFSDRATCALFGDGAVAAVLKRGPVGEGILAIGTLSDGVGVTSVYIPAGGTREPTTAQTVAQQRHHLKMGDGPQIYLQAVDGMISTAESLLAACQMSLADVDLVVPHQPNRRLLDRLRRLAGIPEEKFFINIERVGNTSGASCGIALDQALRSGRIRAGHRVLVVAAGAGYTAGGMLLQVGETLLEKMRI